MLSTVYVFFLKTFRLQVFTKGMCMQYWLKAWFFFQIYEYVKNIPICNRKKCINYIYIKYVPYMASYKCLLAISIRIGFFWNHIFFRRFLVGLLKTSTIIYVCGIAINNKKTKCRETTTAWCVPLVRTCGVTTKIVDWLSQQPLLSTELVR
jgi:hypothetical protein